MKYLLLALLAGGIAYVLAHNLEGRRAPRPDAASAPAAARAESPAPSTARDEAGVVRPDTTRSYRYTVLDSARVDVDRDGAAERVELAATVELDAQGRPIWEDGHQWLVAVRDGADTYPLAERFVPWGTVAFWVVEDEEGRGAPSIVVETTSRFGENGGLRVERFSWDGARGGFVRAERVEAFGRVAHRTPRLPGTGP